MTLLQERNRLALRGVSDGCRFNGLAGRLVALKCFDSSRKDDRVINGYYWLASLIDF